MLLQKGDSNSNVKCLQQGYKEGDTPQFKAEKANWF